MAETNLERIIDGDGHILEDLAGIAKFIPHPYSEGRRPGGEDVPRDRPHAQAQPGHHLLRA